MADMVVMTERMSRRSHGVYASRTEMSSTRTDANAGRRLASAPPTSPTMANSKDPPASPMKQSRISTFFSQSPTSQAKTARRHSPVPDERPSKRQKTIQKPLFRQDSPQLDSDSELHGNQQHSVATERWRHRRSQSPESHPLQLSPAEQASRDNLRAVLSKKLVIENNVSRRRDLDIQQDFEPSDEDETDDEEQRSVASDGDSDSQFKALQEMFSQPSKSKLKGKAASGKKSVKPRGKTVEIGPSGKRYTPLELQVGTILSSSSSPTHPLIPEGSSIEGQV